MQKRQTRTPAYQPVFIKILALTINKIHHESGICRIFPPCCFITKVCIWVPTQAAQSFCPHRQCCFPNPLPSRSCSHRSQHSKREDHSTSLFANKIWGRCKAQCTSKNPASFGITWSTQCKHSPAESVCNCNCTPSSQFISPLRCWIPFDHISSPCLEFKSC